MNESTVDREYQLAFNGSFTSALRWHHLDELWERVRRQPEGWYIYAVGAPPPDQTVDESGLLHFILEIDHLLRTEHDEKYCGIVYADDLQQPSMIKIYDPNNLGVSCGYSENPPLPGWILSRIQPKDMAGAASVPKNRKHWWSNLFGT